jgi:ubiquinone/menaquinone biosynthesis C-methylase UbiE
VSADLTPEATRHLYDTVATSYAELVVGPAVERDLDRAMIAEFEARVAAHPCVRVLDAGCGTGRMTARLADAGLAVAGVDLSPGMLGIARAHFPGTVFTVGRLQALPYGDASFGGVLAWYSVIHTPPSGLPAVFAELHRVLQPHGHLLLGFQAGRGTRRVPHAYGHEIELHAQLHEPHQVAEQLRATGLEVAAELTRAPQGERHPQAFVLARRP